MYEPIPKVNPLHRASKRTRLKAQYRVLRPNVRRDTYTRDGGRCRCCSRALTLNGGDDFQRVQIHERRGGIYRAEESIDITLRSTIALCLSCHAFVDARRKKLVMTCLDEVEWCNGPVAFTGTLPTGEKLTEPRVSSPAMSPQDARKE